MRSLVVQGSNATYSDQDRANIAEEVHSLFLSAVAAANTKSDNDEYALAGSQSQLAPFAADGTYQGDGGVRQLAIGGSATSASTIPGSRLTAAYGVDVLPLLASITTSLQTNDMATLQTNLGDLDTAIHQVASSRTVTGDAMSSLQATATAHDQLSINLTAQISNDTEVDTVAAASDLAKASSVLDASRTVTAHLIQILDPNATTG